MPRRSPQGEAGRGDKKHKTQRGEGPVPAGAWGKGFPAQSPEGKQRSDRIRWAEVFQAEPRAGAENIEGPSGAERVSKNEEL